MTDQETRLLIEEHWEASESGNFDLEHRIYSDHAILEYPQSGERFSGRSIIQVQRRANPANKHFQLRRLLGSGSLWVSECTITYDGIPTHSVSIMEFDDDQVIRETQYFADPFDASPARSALAE